MLTGNCPAVNLEAHLRVVHVQVRSVTIWPVFLHDAREEGLSIVKAAV